MMVSLSRRQLDSELELSGLSRSPLPAPAPTVRRVAKAWDRSDRPPQQCYAYGFTKIHHPLVLQGYWEVSTATKGGQANLWVHHIPRHLLSSVEPTTCIQFVCRPVRSTGFPCPDRRYVNVNFERRLP